MDLRRVVVAVVVAAALVGCARVPSSTPLLMSAQPVTVVLATAIIAPEMLVSVAIDAVTAAPESAVVIAAAATVGAPEQASAIRAALVRLAPADAEAIVAVTKVKRRTPAFTRVTIPDHDNILALVERATR
jgi:hypothetical protein